jgi:hypothetical protein
MFLWMTLIKYADGKMTGRNEAAATFPEAIELLKKREPDMTEYFDVEKEKWIKINE